MHRYVDDSQYPKNVDIQAEIKKIHDNTKQSYQNESEQIDELKKETLGSYIKKAAPNAAVNLAVSASGDKYPTEYTQQRKKRFENKAIKRIKGIETATDKLMKGQYQESSIDELSEILSYLSEEQIAKLSDIISEMLEEDVIDEAYEKKEASGKRYPIVHNLKYSGVKNGKRTLVVVKVNGTRDPDVPVSHNNKVLHISMIGKNKMIKDGYDDVKYHGMHKGD